MHLLLIAAALSNQLWFDTQQQADAVIITPMVTLADDCQCQLTVSVIHQGTSGQSSSSQRGSITLEGKKPQPLASMTLTLPPGEWAQVTVTLSNRQGIIVQQSWQSSARV